MAEKWEKKNMVDRGALTPYFARDSKQYATAGRSSFTQRTTQKKAKRRVRGD